MTLSFVIRPYYKRPSFDELVLQLEHLREQMKDGLDPWASSEGAGVAGNLGPVIERSASRVGAAVSSSPMPLASCPEAMDVAATDGDDNGPDPPSMMMGLVLTLIESEFGVPVGKMGHMSGSDGPNNRKASVPILADEEVMTSEIGCVPHGDGSTDSLGDFGGALVLGSDGGGSTLCL